MRTILIILVLPARLLAQLAFSEVLYNEPEARVNLEWVEIYNQADTAVDLRDFIFISGYDTTSFFQPANTIILPARYAILSRRLTSSEGGDSFEGHWGDSSGYWGDTSIENFRAYEAKMNLSNLSGAVYLINIISGEIAQCVWNSPADEGQSLECDRLEPPSSTWHLSTDPRGSTPGQANSESRALIEADLISFSSKKISAGGGDRIQITYVIPSGCRLTLEIFDDSGHKRSTLLDNASASGQINWYGQAGNGSSLYPGVYMVLTTLTGNRNDSKCTPVVIAP